MMNENVALSKAVVATVGAATVIALSALALSRSKPLPSDAEIPRKKKSEEMLLITGKLAGFFKTGPQPRVETFTLSSGWTEETCSKFMKAAQQVVQANPILSGHMIWRDESIYICPGTFDPDNHKFATEFVMDDVDISKYDTHESRMKFMDEVLAPMTGDRTKICSSQDLSLKRPLFHCTLFRFANNHVCYHIGASHAIADGNAYFLLVDQISSFMNDKKPTPIRWDHPSFSSHELEPSHLTEKDLAQTAMSNVILGFMAYQVRSMFKKAKKEHFWIIQKKNLLDQKKRQLDSNITEYLSSHDIVFSSICQLVQSSNHLSLCVDQRKRNPSYVQNHGGNGYKMFPIPTSVGSNPNHFRNAVNQGYYYETDQLPTASTIRSGRMCYATTWATGFKSIEGTKTICHCPSFAFVRSFPADFCVVFNVDDDNLGVIHSMMDIDEELLQTMKEDWLN